MTDRNSNDVLREKSSFEVDSCFLWFYLLHIISFICLHLSSKDSFFLKRDKFFKVCKFILVVLFLGVMQIIHRLSFTSSSSSVSIIHQHPNVGQYPRMSANSDQSSLTSNINKPGRCVIEYGGNIYISKFTLFLINSKLTSLNKYLSHFKFYVTNRHL